MRIGIGIDTGGTYTDAVMYDFDAERILSSTKAPTTKDDLSVGIGNALDGLPADLLGKAELIALSTTLATNACVENKGGRAKLLFVGVDKRVVQWVGKEYGLPDPNEILFLDSKTDSQGVIVREPDWQSLATALEDWLQGASAVGVVEIDAMDNNAVLENRARDLIVERHPLPVVCGHELFSGLNSLKRGSSALLNARLVPLIADFLEATKAALAARSVTAPVVIVRSDGSLMSGKFAAHRPVETLLCGPAASAVGGIALAKEKDCLIVDMGGTTTDIAIVKDGVPVKVRDGISVGKWSTFVRGIFVDTIGLGGDSAVRFDRYSRLLLEPDRVIPLSVAAARWPQVVEKLRALLGARKSHTLPLHEFFCLVRDISDSSAYSEREIAFCRALRGGPLIFTDAAEALGTDVYNVDGNMDVRRLEEEGVVIRCGFTPTDAMHIKGDFASFNVEAAKLGAEFVAGCLGVSPEALPEMVYDAVKQKLYRNILRVLLEHQYPQFRDAGRDGGRGGSGDGGSGEGRGGGWGQSREGGQVGGWDRSPEGSQDGQLEALISESWKMARNGDGEAILKIGFHTPSALVGIGAPIHIFLPEVARALGARCVIPQSASVANALGAVLGNITVSEEILIKPQYTPSGIAGFVVFGKTRNSHVSQQAEATRIAILEAEAAAREEAERRGASGDITVASRVVVSSPKTSSGMEVLIEIKAVATAIGRVSL